MKTKVLKNKNTTDLEILDKKVWGDDVDYNFDTTVGKDKFTLEIIVTVGRMEIVLNGFQRTV